MVKRGASMGFFGMFGRSEDMRQLDAALRGAGLHPALVPEGVKLAAVGIIAVEGEKEPPAEAYPPFGALMACCALGPEVFAAENGEALLVDTLARIEAALEAGEGQDADIILLMLHAKLLHPQLVERYDIRAEGGE